MCMRQEKEEQAKPKSEQNREKIETFFTQAHQVQGENRTATTIEFVKENKDEMAKQILSAPSLKKAWKVIKSPPHVGHFLSWQITADLCKLKLIQLPKDIVAFGASQDSIL